MTERADSAIVAVGYDGRERYRNFSHFSSLKTLGTYMQLNNNRLQAGTSAKTSGSRYRLLLILLLFAALYAFQTLKQSSGLGEILFYVSVTGVERID